MSATASLATVVYLSLVMGKPLLLEGEAGVGKTEIAKVLSKVLDAKLIRLQCYEGLDANTALYEWNYPKQMLRIKLEEVEHGDKSKSRIRDLYPGVSDQTAAPGSDPKRRRQSAGAADRRDRPRRYGV